MRIIIVAEVNDTEDGIEAKTKIEVENHVTPQGELLLEDPNTGELSIQAAKATSKLLKSLRKVHEKL